MSSIDVRDFKDLFGGWSALALMVGTISAFLSHLATDRECSQIDVKHLNECASVSKSPWLLLIAARRSQPFDSGGILSSLPWIMGCFSIWLALFCPAHNLAFSGPPERLLRLKIAEYDAFYASLIAFVFGFAFALDALRLKRLRHQRGTWVCLALYVVTAALLLFGRYATP